MPEFDATVERRSKDQLVVVRYQQGGEPRRKTLEPALLLGALSGREPADLVGAVVRIRVEKGDLRAVWAAGEPEPAAPAPAPRMASTPTAVANDKFLNPYAFVWTPDRKVNDPDLGDALPASRAQWHPGRWSGRIVATLETTSPLLILDDVTRRPDEHCKEHFHYEVLKDSQGRPLLPASIVTGLLSSDFEAITNSRYRVFAGQQARIGRRMFTREGASAVPARVTDDGDHIELFKGCQVGSGALLLRAAWLPYYRNGSHPAAVPPNGAVVCAELQLQEHYRYDGAGVPQNKFRFWRAVKIAMVNGPISDSAAVAAATAKLASAPQLFQPTTTEAPPSKQANQNRRTYHRAVGDPRVVTGYVVVSGYNMDGKHDERIFFHDRDEAAEVCPDLTEPIRRDWREAIRSYFDAHEGEDLGTARQRLPNRPPEYFSIFLRQGRSAAEQLSPGTLCYAMLGAGGSVVSRLIPVPIARAIYPSSPWDLLPESLQPASSLQQLSPADRVFGWVKQGGSGAIRGAVRVHAVSRPAPEQVEHFVESVPLPILGTPKRYGRFALVDGTPAQLGRGVAREGFYSKDQRLAGRKFYWTHSGLPEDYWKDPHQERLVADEQRRHQEYRRPAAAEGGERNRLNRSVSEWIKEGTTFTVTLDVTDLSPVEMGALLWLFTRGESVRRNIGYGKPLGFGGFCWDLDRARTSLVDGAALPMCYTSLGGPSPVERPSGPAPQGGTSIDILMKEFEKAVCRVFGVGQAKDSPPIRDYLAIAMGKRAYAVHYPRNDSNRDPQGEQFKWFAKNENGGRHGLARPSADDFSPLPYDP